MIDTTQIVWVLAAAAVLLIAIIVFRLTAGRRRHVEIAPPSLDDPVAAPTLSRQRAQGGGGSVFATPDSDLARLKGVGPRLATLLADNGITGIDALAALNPDAASALDARLGAMAGRIARDRLVEQAQLLQAGDIAGYEAQFGRLGGS